MHKFTQIQLLYSLIDTVKTKTKQEIRKRPRIQQTKQIYYSFFLSKNFTILMWVKSQTLHPENLKGNFRLNNKKIKVRRSVLRYKQAYESQYLIGIHCKSKA